MAVSAAVPLIVVWGPWPLGVPGEWTWGTIDGSAVTLVAAILILVVGGAILVGVDRSADFYERSNKLQKWFCALGLVAIAFAWFSVVREPVDWLKLAAGRSRDPWVLYAPGMSGYFTKAQSIESRHEFLAGYRAFVAEGDYLHQGTHPPGLALAYWHLGNALEAVPTLRIDRSSADVSQLS